MPSRHCSRGGNLPALLALRKTDLEKPSPGERWGAVKCLVVDAPCVGRASRHAAPRSPVPGLLCACFCSLRKDSKPNAPVVTQGAAYYVSTCSDRREAPVMRGRRSRRRAGVDSTPSTSEALWPGRPSSVASVAALPSCVSRAELRRSLSACASASVESGDRRGCCFTCAGPGFLDTVLGLNRVWRMGVGSRIYLCVCGCGFGPTRGWTPPIGTRFCAKILQWLNLELVLLEPWAATGKHDVELTTYLTQECGPACSIPTGRGCCWSCGARRTSNTSRGWLTMPGDSRSAGRAGNR